MEQTGGSQRREEQHKSGKKAGNRHQEGRKKCPGQGGQKATHPRGHRALVPDQRLFRPAMAVARPGTQCRPRPATVPHPWGRPLSGKRGQDPGPLPAGARCAQESTSQPQQKNKMAAAPNHKHNKLRQPHRKQKTPAQIPGTPPHSDTHTLQPPPHWPQAGPGTASAEGGQGQTRDRYLNPGDPPQGTRAQGHPGKQGQTPQAGTHHSRQRMEQCSATGGANGRRDGHRL